MYATPSGFESFEAFLLLLLLSIGIIVGNLILIGVLLVLIALRPNTKESSEQSF